VCSLRLAKRPNRHTDNDLVDSFRLAGVTGDSYSLVEMRRATITNNLAFIEYDLAFINADHGPELVRWMLLVLLLPWQAYGNIRNCSIGQLVRDQTLLRVDADQRDRQNETASGLFFVLGRLDVK
jgi:hypothetical protein